jgi:hypothetical protein
MDFDQIFGRKFRSQVSKVYGGGEPPWSVAVGRPPWFMLTMLTRGGELSYGFLVKKYLNIIVFV